MTPGPGPTGSHRDPEFATIPRVDGLGREFPDVVETELIQSGGSDLTARGFRSEAGRRHRAGSRPTHGGPTTSVPLSRGGLSTAGLADHTKLSPLRRSNVIPSTALISPAWRRKIPPPVRGSA